MAFRVILTILFLGAISAARCQTVDFSYTTTTGTFCGPQKVFFTQNCSGNPGGFIWDFGNGSQGVHGTDSTVYLSAGTYTVRLTGLYADSAIVKSKTITINPTPSVFLTADADSICHPGSIFFTAHTASFVATYVWDFGDGSGSQTTNSSTLIHNYADYGNYTAHIKVITAFGCFAYDSLKISVHKFKIIPKITPDKGCIPIDVVLSVTTNIPQGDLPQSYVWDFGDGSAQVPGVSNTIQHTYNITTPVYPHVTITTMHGCVTDTTLGEAAYGFPPVNLHAATLNGIDTFCGSVFVPFKAVANNADSYYWVFGDGGNAMIPDSLVNYKYQDTGHMHIVVTSYFHGCAGAKDSFDIYIKGVVAKFSFQNTCSNKNIFFLKDRSKGHISYYRWTISDNPEIIDSTHFNINHTFPLAGLVPVQLIVRDSLSGCADTVNHVIYTAQPVFQRDRPYVCKDSVINYSVTHTYPLGSGVTYLFYATGNFNDNADDSTLFEVPPGQGIFNDYVVLKHHDPDICDDTLRLSTATTVKGPVVHFTATPDTVCLRIPVTFTNTSYPYFPADTILHWSWDFWDGGSDTVKVPHPRLYAAPGQYIISLKATDKAGCSIKEETSVVVKPIPEITVYPRTDTICLGRDSATLSAYTIDPFVWTPVTNLTCANCDTIKVFPQVTTYYIATATNSGGCSNSDTSLVKVFAPFHIQVMPADTSVCPQVPVAYRSSITGITLWSPPVFLNHNNIPNPTAVADTSVIYSVAISDSAGCYADTAAVHLTIYPLPLVNAGPDRMLIYGTAFTLSPAYTQNPQSYSWNPAGDLSCTHCPQPSGAAFHDMNYTISVISDKGCKAKDDVSIKIACAKSTLWMPAAFTPFNGGDNNYFYPLAQGYKSIKTFIIYNRLGNKVFERKDFLPNISTLGWNGMTKGDNSSSTEAFVWFIEAVCNSGEIVSSKGTVLLIK